MRRIAPLLLVVAAACTGGDREGLTADSAVMQTPGVASDSMRPSANVGIDPGVTDSLVVDTMTMSSPALVLIADSVAGDVLFRRKGKCLSCHGLSGKGIDALGPNLQDSLWLHGDGSFAFIQRMIMEGIARPKVASIGMPSFAPAPGVDPSALTTTLSPEEIYHITAYVYSLSHPGSAVADTTTMPDTLPPIDTLSPPAPPPPRASAPTAAAAAASRVDRPRSGTRPGR